MSSSRQPSPLHMLPQSWARRRGTWVVHAAWLLMVMVLLLQRGRSGNKKNEDLNSRALASSSARRRWAAPSLSERSSSMLRGGEERGQPPCMPLPCDCRHCDNTGGGWASGTTTITTTAPSSSASGAKATSPHAAPLRTGTASSTGRKVPAASWLGVGQPPRNVGEKHVRIIIRVHHLQEAATRSLIWALRAMPEAAKSTPGAPNFTVDFALVATESKGLPVVHRIAQDMWRTAVTTTRRGPDSGGPDVFVADTTGSFYALAANRSTPFRCNEAEERRYRDIGGELYVRLHCAYDNHAYYQATDVAMLDVLRGCAWCTHVLVTNSDNSYHPHFLLETLQQDADLVTTDFVDHAQSMPPVDWKLGVVDLGGVLAAKAVVAKTGGFIASLPPNAGPQETHDNDYWFVHRAFELGATRALVHKVMFFHN